MKCDFSIAEIGKIVSALQVNCPQDYDAYCLATNLIGLVHEQLPSGLFADWLAEFNISTTLIPAHLL